jgi:hypothetical protein
LLGREPAEVTGTELLESAAPKIGAAREAYEKAVAVRAVVM